MFAHRNLSDHQSVLRKSFNYYSAILITVVGAFLTAVSKSLVNKIISFG